MIFLVPYAYDRMPDGKPREGIPANRLGSKARCDALVKIEKRLNRPGAHHIFTSWVLAAGFSKDSPDRATAKAPTSLAYDMSKYLFSLGYTETRHGYHSWGTFEETQSIIEHIEYWCNFNRTSAEVYVSTNLGHMPRVWLCWLFLKPKDWKVNFVLADHSFTRKEWLQETAKFFQYLYKFVFRKW